VLPFFLLNINTLITLGVMYPVTDVVVMLLETPFLRWNSNRKNDLLKVGKSIPVLLALAPDKKLSKVFCMAFNSNLYQQHSGLPSIRVTWNDFDFLTTGIHSLLIIKFCKKSCSVAHLQGID